MDPQELGVGKGLLMAKQVSLEVVEQSSEKSSILLGLRKHQASPGSLPFPASVALLAILYTKVGSLRSFSNLHRN